jgi:hypothetical protein
VIASLALLAEMAAPIGHSHNDYWQKRPFWDAFESGMSSFEADVFLINGQLKVGHDLKEAEAGSTLSKLYLDPMERALPSKGSWQLLVDIKADGEKVLPVLFEELRPRRSLMAKLKVIISGDRPIAALKAHSEGLAAIDGRLTDLDDPSPAFSWISSNWRSSFRWAGFGPMNPEESEKLKDIVTRAHAKGRKLRFWAAPDTPRAWQTLREAGVDIIGTDKPSELGPWLRREK